MSATRPIEHVENYTISATLPLETSYKTPGCFDVITNGAPAVIIECITATSTPVVKCYVKASASGTWRKWRCFQNAVNTDTRTLRTPDASITLVAGDQIIIQCAGFYAVRLERQSGTSAVLVGRTCSDIGSLLETTAGLVGASSAYTALLTSSFTRPANTTAYASGQVMGDGTTGLLTFSGAARFEGGGGVISSADLSLSTLGSPVLECELWLFTATVQVLADQATWAPTDAENRTCFAVIPFTSNDAYAGTLNRKYTRDGLGIVYKCATAFTTLYGYLIAKNAYASAANSEVFDVTIGVDEN